MIAWWFRLLRRRSGAAKSEEFLLVWLIAVILLAIGVAVGWRLRGKFDEMRKGAKKTRAVQVQSQTRYTWWTETPRFVPLPERESGAWTW